MYASSIVCHERKTFFTLPSTSHTWKEKHFGNRIAENPHTIHHYMHNMENIHDGRVIRLRKICLILENMLEKLKWILEWVLRMERRGKNFISSLFTHIFTSLSRANTFVTWPFNYYFIGMNVCIVITFGWNWRLEK